MVWVKDNAGRTATASFTIASTAFCSYAAGDVVKEFSYTRGIESLSIPCSGTYKLEVWGAQGGSSRSQNSTTIKIAGGYGGYSYGNVSLTAGQMIYVGVGGAGTYAPVGADTTTYVNGGYNGGGTAGAMYTYDTVPGSGGGATHIAINNNRGVLANYESYKSEILIVAGGGGGSGGYYNSNTANSDPMKGGTGGGASGGNSSAVTASDAIAYGGTQSAGGAGAQLYGTTGSFGQGGGYTDYGSYKGHAGGGGGYYGGGGGGNYNNWTGAGGGSGYIGGVTGGSMTNGQRSGDGYAKITLVSIN